MEVLVMNELETLKKEWDKLDQLRSAVGYNEDSFDSVNDIKKMIKDKMFIVETKINEHYRKF